MKKVSIFLLIFSSIAVVYAREYFMYIGEKKHYFEVSPNKVLVHFVENTDTVTIRNTLTRSTSNQVSDIVKTDCKGLYVISFLDADTAKTKEMVRQWKNKDTILYSCPVFIDEYGEDIRNGVFSDCSNLATVTIGNSVIGIYSDVFSGCSEMKSITIHAITPPVIHFYIENQVFRGIPNTIPIHIPCGTYNDYSTAARITSLL